MDRKKDISYSISEAFFDVFLEGKAPFSIMDYLNNSYCDEIAEVDIKNNTYRLLSHVAGKYYSPVTDGTYIGLFNFAIKNVVHPDDVAIYNDLNNPETILDKLQNSKTPNFRFAHFRYKTVNGEYRWFEQVLVTGEENGLKDGVIRIYIFDIHAAKMRNLGKKVDESKLITNEANELTGLLIEKSFIHQAENLTNKKKNIPWCVISLDIEHFKLFDDWYGREKGDYLLACIGKAIENFVNKNKGLAGYFGQDDFGVLIPYSEENVNALFELVRAEITNFNLSVGFMPAVGVCLLKDAKNVIDAIDKSSIASFHAKQDIRNKIKVYDPNEHKDLEGEYLVLMDAMRAIKDNEITFYLQPQVRISSGKVVGAEALARWIKPDGTVIQPGEFIPILEKYGFIADLDLNVWEKVFEWVASLIKRGIKPVPISINVSRVDVFTIDIYKTLIDLANKYNVPRNLIKVEITESAYAENSEIIGELVDKLRKEDFMILMDDFGSGYSSLNMLSNIEVDAIKLDALFLRRNENEVVALKILESVVNMSKQIGLPMIVEGVEDKEQVDFLSDLGCRYAQGYYYNKPLAIPVFEKLLENADNIDDRGFVVKANDQFRIREFMDSNIYSDSMLNTILGAVAIYSLHDDRVDIVRYNEQFYQAVASNEFSERLLDIGRFMPEEEKPLLIDTLKKAMKDKANGAIGIFRFYKEDGKITVFRIRFFYIGENDGYPKFYGSAFRITEAVRLEDELKIIAGRCAKTMIFAEKNNDKWIFKVGTNGIEHLIKYSSSEIESVLNNIEESKHEEHKIAYKKIMDAFVFGQVITRDFDFINKDNNRVRIKITCEPIDTYSKCADYVVILEAV